MALHVTTTKKNSSDPKQCYYHSKRDIEKLFTDTSSNFMKSIILNASHQYSCVIRWLENLQHSHNRDSNLQGYSTLSNLDLRKSELQQKLVTIKNKNVFILKEILEARLPSKHIEEPTSLNNTKRSIRIPFQMISRVHDDHDDDELVDVVRLKQISKDLETEIAFYKTKFASKRNYEELQHQKKEKQLLKEDLQQKHKTLLQRHKILKENIEKLKVESNLINAENSLSALIDRSKLDNNPLEHFIEENLMDSDEPADVIKVNELTTFIKRFNKLFANGDYETAAKLAASSPDGILRNYETFKLFQNVTKPRSSAAQSSPVMSFCKSVMVPSTKFEKLSPQLSIEVIKCAVNSNDIRRTKHWLCGGRLSFSTPLGDFLFDSCCCSHECKCSYILFALHVYLKVEAHFKILECHLKLGNFAHVENALFSKQNSHINIIELFSKHPSMQLLKYLPCTKRTCVPFATAVGIYLQQGLHNELLTLLEQVSNNGYHGYDLMTCLLAEMYSDQMSEEKWMEVVCLCKVYDRSVLAEELYACLTTRMSLEKATCFCLMDYRS